MRTELKVLRTKHNLTQEQIAERLGITRQYYSLVENGDIVGKFDFWCKLQNEFNLGDDEVWKMQKNI